MVEALSAYLQVLEKDPHDKEVMERASVCLLQLQRYNEALVLQERLVFLEPDNAQVRIELGFNYLNHQERPAEAAKVLGEAAELEPSIVFVKSDSDLVSISAARGKRRDSCFEVS